MGKEVDNQYRLAMEDEMPALRGHAIVCSFAYHEAESALENKAWSSTAADTFSNELGDHHRLAGNDGEDAGSALETRFENEPEKVPEDDDRANWP